MNKLLYKIELCLVKVIPMIYALLSLLNTTLSYFGINAVILSYIGSVSLVTLLLLYVTSYVFKFCEYHRMFIHYTTITWILNITLSCTIIYSLLFHFATTSISSLSLSDTSFSCHRFCSTCSSCHNYFPFLPLPFPLQPHFFAIIIKF